MDKTIKILIVDDDVVLVKTLCKQLCEAGMSTYGLNDPVLILDAIERVRPNLLFLDIDLNGQSGIEICRRVKEHSPELPLIFISSQLSPEIKTAAIEAGGLAYVDKPLTAHLLAAYARRYAAEWGEKPEEKAGDTNRVTMGAIEIDFRERLLLFPDGSMRDLSPMQTTVLRYLTAHAGETVSKEDLSYEVWRSRDMIKSREQSLHNTIHRLRVMLSVEPALTITNVRGYGYILETPVKI
ncbi:response regulator transcription factor [Porphyromonas macacae]|uniref:Transcriptional regulatory protein YycF n=1 Tax=Porphyromonas macacae TaxID=28115 RepID=A0A379DEU6_9PORP|nr:response regulator [Porphyromonas macacae]SUB76928.1 Transcriptional regulatory protein YycF [Porphyromonas macacae]